MISSQFPVVRVASPDDEEDVMVVARSVHEENAPRGVGGVEMDFDEHAVREKVRRSFGPCNSESGVYIGIIGERGYPEGAALLEVGRFWYAKDGFFLSELFLHVLEPYRRSNNAKALIEFSKFASRRLNLPLYIGVLTSNRAAPKVRLYERALGKPQGAYFAYNVGA